MNSFFCILKIKMARSHHRKKHKTHLRQYQQTHEGGMARAKKGNVIGTLIVIGVILGIAIGYFGSGGSVLWIAGLAVAGGLAGYITGRYLDR